MGLFPGITGLFASQSVPNGYGIPPELLESQLPHDIASRRSYMATIAQPTLQSSIAAVQSKSRQRKGYDYWAPTAKVSAGVLAGGATILISAFLGPHWRN